MDQGPLVEMMIEDGKRLVERLIAEGVPVTAAFWIKTSEDGQWFLYIATPLVQAEGATKAAYRRVNEVIRLLSPPFSIHPLEIKVISDANPITRDVQAIQQKAGTFPGSPIHGTGTRIGLLSVEGAYFYPAIVAGR
jgi:hypothetical protein